MRVLAIDPGPTDSGIVIWDGALIRRHDILPTREVFEVVEEFWAREERGDVMAIELMQCYGMPVGQPVMQTCYWIGRLYERAFACLAGADFLDPRPDEVHERRIIGVWRSHVKLHLTGRRSTKNSNIRAALVERFGGKGTKAAPGITYGLAKHKWSAFAIAVYVYDRLEQGAYEEIQQYIP